MRVARLSTTLRSSTTIGVGLDYNEDLMTKLAYKSDGNHYFAEHAAELAGIFDRTDFAKSSRWLYIRHLSVYNKSL